MRVLFSIAHLSKGGGQSIQAFQLWRLLSERFDSEFICLRAADATHRDIESQGLTVVGDLRFPSGIIALARAIRGRARKYDVLQAFDSYFTLPAARLGWRGPLCLRLGMDPALDIQSRYGRMAAWLVRLGLPPLLDRARIIVNSPNLLKSFRRWHPVFIPNGVDLNRLQIQESPDEARGKLGLPEGSPLVLFVGKVIPRKGLEDLMEALRSLRGVRAVVVGNTSEEHYGDRYYRRLVSTFRDVLGQVTFTGEVPFHRIPLYLRAADIFVFPSRLEGMPNAMLEAMAAGLAVIASDTPAHRALIDPGTNGMLYHDVDGLVAGLRVLLDDLRLRESLSARASRVVRDHFSLSATADAYARFYEELVSQAG